MGTMKLSDRENTTPYHRRMHRLNRKNKKQITVAAVLLFFLMAGAGYFLWSSGSFEVQDTREEMTGVLDTLGEIMPEVQPVEQSVSPDMEKQTEEVVVYVCGAVNEPGIYALTAGSRLHEAIVMAGGFSAKADPAYHNLARVITDGERIYILSAEETAALETEQKVAGEGRPVETGTGLININTATAELLMELPGIGEAKAAAILEYRARIGSFTAVEELMNVSGIGEAMFEKIKDKITLK